MDWAEMWVTRAVRDEMAEALGGHYAAALRSDEHVGALGLLRIMPGMVECTPTLRLGELVEVVDKITLTPYGALDKGERGVVSAHDLEHGEAKVLLEHWHPGLDDFDNQLWLIPHYTDELLKCVTILGLPPSVASTQIG